MIQACYYLMRTGLPQENNSTLLENIEQGFLPSIDSMKAFLIECAEVFEMEETMRGGQLDECKLKAKIK